MSKLEIEATHAFSVAEAKAKIDQLIQKFASTIDMTVHWTDDQDARLDGKRASGNIKLAAGTATLALELSFFVSAFKGAIHDKIVKELTDAGFTVKS